VCLTGRRRTRMPARPAADDRHDAGRVGTRAFRRGDLRGHGWRDGGTAARRPRSAPCGSASCFELVGGLGVQGRGQGACPTAALARPYGGGSCATATEAIRPGERIEVLSLSHAEAPGRRGRGRARSPRPASSPWGGLHAGGPGRLGPLRPPGPRRWRSRTFLLFGVVGPARYGSPASASRSGRSNRVELLERHAGLRARCRMHRPAARAEGGMGGAGTRSRKAPPPERRRARPGGRPLVNTRLLAVKAYAAAGRPWSGFLHAAGSRVLARRDDQAAGSAMCPRRAA